MKVCVIGCGGIGSFTAQFLNKLVKFNQLPNYTFTFYDDDVVEHKNLMYQNFEDGDINEYKTESLEFNFSEHTFKCRKVEQSMLNAYDMFILCVDNNPIRRDVYNHCKETGKKFIDARANGRQVGIFSSDTENYLNSLSSSNESHSCQLEYQIKEHKVELGNIVIASILTQHILSFSRTGELPLDYIASF